MGVMRSEEGTNEIGKTGEKKLVCVCVCEKVREYVRTCMGALKNWELGSSRHMVLKFIRAKAGLNLEGD